MGKLAHSVERLAEDTKRLVMDKNREENLQKMILHASRASEISRRNQLVTTEEGCYDDLDHPCFSFCPILTPCACCYSGRRALEDAKAGSISAMNLARLIATSPEFRAEMIETLGKWSSTKPKRGNGLLLQIWLSWGVPSCIIPSQVSYSRLWRRPLTKSTQVPRKRAREKEPRKGNTA